MISDDKRRYDFDAIRATMMLLGIVFHACVSFMVLDIGELWPHRSPYSNIFFDAVVGTIHAFRIPLFFMISGFFLTRQLSRHSRKKIIIKRIRRVLLPFLVCFLFIAPIVKYAFFALILEANGDHSIELFSREGLFIFIDYWSWNTVHFWFLYYLIFFHIIQFSLDSISNIKATLSKIPLWKTYVFILILQWLVISIFGIKSTDGSYTLSPNIGSIIYYYSFYYLGNQTYYHITTFDKWISNSKRMYLVAVITTTIFLLIRLITFNASYGIALDVIIAFFSILATHSLIISSYHFFRRFFNKKTRFSSYFSKASYLIYIVHLPILAWGLYIFHKWITNPFLLSITLILFTSIISILLYEIQQKFWKKLI